MGRGEAKAAFAIVLLAATTARGQFEPIARDEDAQKELFEVGVEIRSSDWGAVVHDVSHLASVFSASLVDQHGALVPARKAMRARLAGLSHEGCLAFESRLAKDADRALEEARGDREKLDLLATRCFPLVQGAYALEILAADLEKTGEWERAASAWRELLGHPSPGERIVAARRLVPVAERIGDGRLAAEAALALREADPEIATSVERWLEQPPATPAVAVTAGTLAAVASFALPNAAVGRFALPSDAVKAIDWRDAPSTTIHGLELPNVRRLLTGHAATERLVLVHLGAAIVAHDAQGRRAWTVGDMFSLRDYLHDLLEAECLPREGIATTASAGYASLDLGGVPVPRVRLVAFRLSDGKTLWSATGVGDGISHSGTPLVLGDRVFCGAVSFDAPGETWVVARSAKDGALLWKRPLAESSGQHPRLVPAPALALVHGELVAISENGVVAALAPGTGEVLWASRYKRDAELDVDGSLATINSPEGKALTERATPPPLPVPCGGLVLAPQDTSALRLVRALDGSPLGRMPYRSSSEELEGFAGGRVVLAGDWSATLIDVQSVAVALKVRVLVDSTQAPLGEREPRSGHAALVGDTLLLPGEKEIDAVHIPDGSCERVLEWDRSEQGDLVVGGGRVFSVGARAARLLGSQD
jgi:hypothetical protein